MLRAGGISQKLDVANESTLMNSKVLSLNGTNPWNNSMLKWTSHGFVLAVQTA
jgi:hypothetical protein